MPTSESAADATAAEAQEIEVGGDYVTAHLAGQPVRILMPSKFRASALRALNAGDLDTFADLVLHADDVDTFFEVDPTGEEISELVTEAADTARESLGKSSARSRSTKRTRRK